MKNTTTITVFIFLFFSIVPSVLASDTDMQLMLNELGINDHKIQSKIIGFYEKVKFDDPQGIQDSIKDLKRYFNDSVITKEAFFKLEEMKDWLIPNNGPKILYDKKSKGFSADSLPLHIRTVPPKKLDHHSIPKVKSVKIILVIYGGIFLLVILIIIIRLFFSSPNTRPSNQIGIIR